MKRFLLALALCAGLLLCGSVSAVNPAITAPGADYSGLWGCGGSAAARILQGGTATISYPAQYDAAACAGLSLTCSTGTPAGLRLTLTAVSGGTAAVYACSPAAGSTVIPISSFRNPATGAVFAPAGDTRFSVVADFSACRGQGWYPFALGGAEGEITVTAGSYACSASGGTYTLLRELNGARDTEADNGWYWLVLSLPGGGAFPEDFSHSAGTLTADRTKLFVPAGQGREHMGTEPVRCSVALGGSFPTDTLSTAWYTAPTPNPGSAGRLLARGTAGVYGGAAVSAQITGTSDEGYLLTVITQPAGGKAVSHSGVRLAFQGGVPVLSGVPGVTASMAGEHLLKLSYGGASFELPVREELFGG